MTTQQKTLLASSNEEPDLKWAAPRAPLAMPRNISPSERYEYIHLGSHVKKIERDFDELSRRFDRVMHKREYSPKSSATREDLAELFPEIFEEVEHVIKQQAPHHLISHEKGNCGDRLSSCVDCVTLKRLVKAMSKLSEQIEEIVEQYYVCLGKMPTHQFCIRVAQDALTFAKQNVFMKAQFARGLRRYEKHIGTKYRTGKIREFMIEEKSDKQQTCERSRARDLKYEEKFVAQNLGPIEHVRGACDEDYSMCIDCVSTRKCYVMSKRVPARSNAAYGLLWRYVEEMPQQQCTMLVNGSLHWLAMATYNELCALEQTYMTYTSELGPNYEQKYRLMDFVRTRMKYLESTHRTGEKFHAQALAVIDLNIPSLDKITETLSRLITTNNIAVDPTEWARRLTSFVLMLMQLCAESSLFIKMTAVAQFLTHFNLPGLATFRGYAQQLAQVFQAAVERIHGREYNLHDHLVDNDDDDREHVYDADTEGPFVAQGEGERPEGILAGTAKLFCAMAGLSDYDVKMNGSRIARIDQLSRTIVSTERLAQFIGRLFKYAYEAAMLHIFHVHPDMRELQLVSEAIPKWMEDVTSYYNNEGLMRVTKNPDEARQVLRWHKQGDEYNTLLWKFKVVPKAYAIFKNVYNLCDKMYQAGAPYLAESAMRVSPFTVLITGASGLGKSVMQYTFIIDIMRDAFGKRGMLFMPGEQIHTHQSGGKFWDGYKEQAVIAVDDIFQSMDAAETIEQCMDLVKMKNMVSWPVSKADLASKGSTFMVSELLVMTGNVGVPHDISKVIRSFDAVRRRIDMMIHLSVIPEFLDSSGRLDKIKVAGAFPITYVDGLAVSADITSVFRFDVHNNQGHSIMKHGTYPDLVKLAIQMKEWEKSHEEGVIRLNYLRAGLDVRGQPIKKEDFQAQMWSNLMNRPKNHNAYEGDLLFEADVVAISQMLHPNPGIRPFPQEGFLSEEERIEIFAAIAQEQLPDPTWTERMNDVYTRARGAVSDAGKRFVASLDQYLGAFRARVTESVLFKVGAMVTIAISIVTLGLLSYRLMHNEKPVQDVVCEHVSGDEKTRQVKTVFAEISGDEKTRQVQTRFEHKAQKDVMTKVIHGAQWVAVRTGKSSTTWVPEKELRGRKPLCVSDVLWTDDDSELPHDLLCEKGGEIVAQACPDRNAYNIGVNRVTNNAVVVHAYQDGRIVSTLRGLFVYGRVLMLPNHFFFGLEDNVEIELVNSHGLVHKFRSGECVRKTPKDDMDITFLRLPKRFQCYADIRSHFHSMDGVNKYPMNEAMLWIIDGENNGKMITLCDNITKDTVVDYRVSSHDSTVSDGNIHLVKSYVYRGVTLAGYCGAPLIWLNPSVQGGHILGIHVAGSKLRGVTTPVTKEFLYAFLAEWNDISIIVPDLDHNDGVMGAQSKRAVSRNTGVSHYGRVSGKNQVRLPTDTNIIPSPLYGVFEPVTAPAMLHATPQVNPLRNGILKQKVPLVSFPQETVDAAVQHLKNTILSVDSPYHRKPIVLTSKEALNGFPGDQWMPPMNLHTSPGYPYINSNTSRNGKFDFVTGEPGERELHVIVEDKLRTRIENGERRRVDMTLFMDILKDERVKLEKIPIGKTRIFNVAPFDLNVAVRMYFQSFAAHLMHNHVYGECAVGVNPHSDEWGMMFRHLCALGQNWIGGDYSNYDKQLSYQLLKAILTIIDDFYHDDYGDIRECLFETMFTAFHIAERDVYRVPQGNPSGIVMTSLINSLVNSLMMRIMYVELGGSLTTFDDNVRIKTYGDDNLGVVSNNAPWFNMVTISAKFAEFGIVYTQPNKEAVSTKHYMNEDEITFLKRGFRSVDGRVLAPLALDSIHEMINWIRRSNDDTEATRANFLAACREMYHHERDAFDLFVAKVYTFAQQRAFKLPYTDYVTSGEYWGAENAGRVNLSAVETTHHSGYCSDLENEEALFRAQSKRAPRKTKAVWQLLCDLLILTVIINSTPTTQTPNEDTASSATNADNITSRTEITAFSDSSIVTISTPQNVSNVPPTPVDPYMKQTLTDYLSRVYYYSGEWSATAAPGSLIAQITFPNFLFSVPQIWDKLKNFTYFRAGVKIALRINGSKFHYGQMLVSYSPQYNNTLDLQPATNNIYSASGCPSFTISPAENEVHEFTLPFALPYQYIPMYYLTSGLIGGAYGDTAFQFGVMNLYVLNPLSNASGVPTPVSYTIFANFVDVDVAGYNPISYTIPVRQFRDQASLPATLTTEPPRPSVSIQVDPLPPFTGVEETDPFVAQKASPEQQKKSEKGIVGGVLESVSAISGALSFVPEIGVVAAGISTVAGLGAQVANYFGWTNPVSLRAIQPIVQQYTNLANTHGLIDCQNLALSADSCVSPQAALMGGSAKEMNMLYIAQTPTLLAAGITWAAADATNTGLYETIVSPCAEFTSTSLLRTFPTLLSWVSRSCLEWRGSIRYHIQITCSQMHVGRLRVSFIPLNSLAALTDNSYASGANMIIDIQQQTTMSFTMPYLSHQPWMQTNRNLSTPNIGYIRISVLNELNHPTVPVPAVYINVWTSAGPDFQLARPSGRWLRGYWTTTTNDPEPPLPLEEAEEFVAQGLTREMIREMPAPSLIPAHGSNEVHICTADEFHHVKDIIMRPTWISSTVAIGAGDNYIALTIDPFAPVARYTGINGHQMDYLSYFRLIFRYSRGSNRVILTPNNNSLSLNLTTSVVANDAFDRQGGILFTQAPRVRAPGVVATNASVMQQYMHDGLIFAMSDMQQMAVIPYYATTYGIPNAAWAGGPIVASFNVYGVTPTSTISYQGKPEISLAAGDDYELIFLVGPPALTSTGA